jgi:chromosomal replication initiation ATPase DnaA
MEAAAPAYVSLRRGSTPRAQILRIIAEEEARARVRRGAVMGKGRERATVDARHAAMRRVKALFPSKSSVEIGRLFGRDHTTVLYALGTLTRQRP